MIKHASLTSGKCVLCNKTEVVKGQSPELCFDHLITIEYGKYIPALARTLESGVFQATFARKEVNCTFCNDPTRNTGHVCDDCVTMLSAGMELLLQAQEKDREIKKPHRVGLPDLYRKGDEFEFGTQSMLFLDIAKRLAGSCNQRDGAEGGNRTILMTDDQLKAYRDLEEFCRRLAMENYKKGHSDGSNMLYRIAAGEISIQKMNAANK
jgi:hypothetical protein